MNKVSKEKLIKINLCALIICCFIYNIVILNHYGVIKGNKVEAKENSVFVPATIVEKVVYDNMTVSELGIKLEKSLKNELTGYGIVYAKYAIEYGVDPYLALAISLHETGCTNVSKGCSLLVKNKNNVGGMKCASSKSCKFESLDEGIRLFIVNIANNYYADGLNTPELMQRRYTGKNSSTWAYNINWFINKIKNA